MKFFNYLILALSLCLFQFGISYSVHAGEVDLLIQKLVKKGVLSQSDAEDLVNEIRKEKAKPEKVVKEATPHEGFGLPKWVKLIEPYGDLRLRYDTQAKEYEDGSNDYTRNRWRFRLRFGLKAKTSETTEVGIRLASGSGFQNTTNQSYDDHARGKNIFIDQAYALWKPNELMTFAGGKHKNPLFTTPLVWDPDVQPEGFSESFQVGLNDTFGLFANLGQWVIAEESKTNDPFMLAFQVGSEIKPAKNVTMELAASYYDFRHLDRLGYDAGDINDDRTFIGYNQKYGQQMVFDRDGDLINEWGCIELGAKIKFGKVFSIPFSVFGSYILNDEVDVNDLIANGFANAAGDPDDLLAYGGDDRDSGWLVGFDLGNKKKKGDWYLQYWYQVLEDYAFPAVFVDSDFHGGGTNNRGHKLTLRYFLTNSIYANATGYLTERDDERKDGKFDEDRLQLDMVFKF